MRAVDADELRKHAFTINQGNGVELEPIDVVPLAVIDNAQTVEPEKVLVANVTFDKDQLEQIIRDRVIEPIKNGELVLQTDERPRGKWIHRRIITKDRSFDVVVCSNCQTEFSWDAETGVSMDNYMTCPNCTADMQEGGAKE